jgi:cell division protein FtsI/penicillin-binding protein 2
MGITSPLSTNPAMTIGGLPVGVTPLDMARAYETIADGGERVTGSMALGASPSGSRKSMPAATPSAAGATRTSTGSI